MTCSATRRRSRCFHAARQDLEIFYHDAQLFPVPLFDTQVAAMVCGFGEQVGYETLVRKIARADLDKSSRFNRLVAPSPVGCAGPPMRWPT